MVPTETPERPVALTTTTVGYEKGGREFRVGKEPTTSFKRNP